VHYESGQVEYGLSGVMQFMFACNYQSMVVSPNGRANVQINLFPRLSETRLAA